MNSKSLEILANYLKLKPLEMHQILVPKFNEVINYLYNLGSESIRPSERFKIYHF